MTELRKRLEARLKFDEHWFESYAKQVCVNPKYESERVGCTLLKHYEKTKPILKCLIDCVEALERIVTYDRRLPDFTDNPQTMMAHEAIAKLEEAIS